MQVLYALHAVSGDASHLALARKFNGWVFTAPLAAGRDDLADLPFPHANFHLPEVVGNARAFELTGNATDAAVVHGFFDAITTNHTYATGGSNSGECWQQPRDLGNFLSTQARPCAGCACASMCRVCMCMMYYLVLSAYCVLLSAFCFPLTLLLLTADHLPLTFHHSLPRPRSHARSTTCSRWRVTSFNGKPSQGKP